MENYWQERKRSTDEGYPIKDFNSISEDAQYQRDKARIIHSASFRRLQAKTQVLSLGDSDFYRTRLTHSLEVAQLGSSICESLKAKYKDDTFILSILPSTSLIESICLAHDLGHPPFGHGGEKALNCFMRDHGGFEGNGQTMRIAAKLGEYSPNHGIDLTRRTLLGLLKYPILHKNAQNYEPGTEGKLSKPPKCIHDDEEEILDWILSPLSMNDRTSFMDKKISKTPWGHNKAIHKSLDTSIMELADDIAYGVHDLEDALALGLVTEKQWKADVIDILFDVDSITIVHDDFYITKLFSDSGKDRKHAISRMVAYFVQNVSIEFNDIFDCMLLKGNVVMEKDAKSCLEVLKDFIKKHVIMRTQVQSLEFKGQEMVLKLYSTLIDNPLRLLPEGDKEKFNNSEHKERVVCDYIAGMTDVYATKLYRRLFIPDIGSVFDRL